MFDRLPQPSRWRCIGNIAIAIFAGIAVLALLAGI